MFGNGHGSWIVHGYNEVLYFVTLNGGTTWRLYEFGKSEIGTF